MGCRATARTIPFPMSETASLCRVPQNVCYARASTLPSSGVAALLSLRIARINPPTCSFSEARVSTLEKPEGPVDQKLDVISFFFLPPPGAEPYSARDRGWTGARSATERVEQVTFYLHPCLDFRRKQNPVPA